MYKVEKENNKVIPANFFRQKSVFSLDKAKNVGIVLAITRLFRRSIMEKDTSQMGNLLFYVALHKLQVSFKDT